MNKILIKLFYFFVVTVAILTGCSDNDYKPPRNESLLLSAPNSTISKMEAAGMPRDTQIALAMRFDSAMCSFMHDEVRTENSFGFLFLQGKVQFAVSMGWETSEGYIDKKWTNYKLVSQLSFPTEFYTCKDIVQQWVERYGFM